MTATALRSPVWSSPSPYCCSLPLRCLLPHLREETVSFHLARLLFRRFLQRPISIRGVPAMPSSWGTAASTIHSTFLTQTPAMLSPHCAIPSASALLRFLSSCCTLSDRFTDFHSFADASLSGRNIHLSPRIHYFDARKSFSSDAFRPPANSPCP